MYSSHVLVNELLNMASVQSELKNASILRILITKCSACTDEQLLSHETHCTYILDVLLTAMRVRYFHCVYMNTHNTNQMLGSFPQ